MLERALYLASLGFHVFPCIPGGKIPAIDAFPTRATTDPDQIKKWWVCPVLDLIQDYNVGISTSRFQNGDRGLLVIDVDNKGGKTGDSDLLNLEMEGKEFPPTLEQSTPTGGRHLIYVADEAVRQSAGRLAPGLDIRSRGGYILGAGSKTERGEYAFRGRVCPPARAPAWCTAFANSGRGARAREGVAPVVSVDATRANLRAMEYLYHHAPSAVEGSGGDHTTFTVAARLKDFGCTKEHALELLLSYWNDRCSPPWKADELATKVENAYEYGNSPVGVDAPEVQFAPVSTNYGQSEKMAARIGRDAGPSDIASTPGNSEKIAGDGGVQHPFDRINETYAFVIAGGGSHILFETTDAKDNPTLEHLSEHAFHKKHAAEFIQAGKKSEPVTEAWMRHKGRRSYDGIVFRPEQETPPRFYNLWQGFAVDPWPAEEPPSIEAQAALDAFLDHTLTNVCREDKKLTRWLIGYFAHMVQKPGEKPLVALVFCGEKGVGKNALVERVGFLLGSHFLVTSNRRYLVGNFNGHLERLLLFVLDEAFWSGDKQAEGTLKDLVTGTTHVIEHKGKETFTVDNKTRIAIIGNEDWLVPASHDERRFAVFDVGSGRKQDRAFFTTMREGMERGGYRLLLQYLKAFDLRDLDFNEAPQTSGLLEQKHASLDPFSQWWLDCLTEGRIVSGDLGGQWIEKVETDRFRDAFRRYAKERNIRSRTPESTAVGKLLKKIAPGIRKRRVRQGQDLFWFYYIPSLAESRKTWEAHIGHAIAWSSGD